MIDTVPLRILFVALAGWALAGSAAVRESPVRGWHAGALDCSARTHAVRIRRRCRSWSGINQSRHPGVWSRSAVHRRHSLGLSTAPLASGEAQTFRVTMVAARIVEHYGADETVHVGGSSGCQRSRSNSSSETLSCRRILKNSGGPISRPPCSGMVTDRPSLCTQRSGCQSGGASRNRAPARPVETRAPSR